MLGLARITGERIRLNANPCGHELLHYSALEIHKLPSYLLQFVFIYLFVYYTRENGLMVCFE